jgi:hypothetical protein
MAMSECPIRATAGLPLTAMKGAANMRVTLLFVFASYGEVDSSEASAWVTR